MKLRDGITFELVKMQEESSIRKEQARIATEEQIQAQQRQTGKERLELERETIRVKAMAEAEGRAHEAKLTEEQNRRMLLDIRSMVKGRNGLQQSTRPSVTLKIVSKTKDVAAKPKAKERSAKAVRTLSRKSPGKKAAPAAKKAAAVTKKAKAKAPASKIVKAKSPAKRTSTRKVKK